MSVPQVPLFERYRDALRRGHVAALHGRHLQAIEAYREAAGHVGDRSAPYVGIGRVELALGRPVEAITAFEWALQRGPSDEAALDGLVEALTGLGRRADAADGLDRLATAQLEDGRWSDALTTVERAIELAESRWRRALFERLRDEHAASGKTGHALPAGEVVDTGWLPPGAAADARALASRVELAGVSGDVRGLLDGAIAHAGADRSRAALDACEDAVAAAPTDPEVHATLAWLLERDGRHVAARGKRALLERYLRVLDDPPALDAAAFDAEIRSDIPALLEVAVAHARVGRLVTALDTCFTALALAPAEPSVHLAIGRIRLALGWRDRAADDAARLARLLELTEDVPARASLAAFVERDLGHAPALATGPG